MNNYVLRIIFVILVSNGVKSEDESPHVTLEQGELKGTFMKSRDGRTFSAFMGIPYADKPEKFEVMHLKFFLKVHPKQYSCSCLNQLANGMV
jgi:hypothetical protein